MLLEYRTHEGEDDLTFNEPALLFVLVALGLNTTFHRRDPNAKEFCRVSSVSLVFAPTGRRARFSDRGSVTVTFPLGSVVLNTRVHFLFPSVRNSKFNYASHQRMRTMELKGHT